MTPPARVEYRPIPGIPGYRVGSNRSVWRDVQPPGRPPPWDEPRWVRLKAKAIPDGSPAVTLRVGGRVIQRSTELLYRAAFAADPLSWTARIGTGPARVRPAPIAPELVLARVPGPVPSPPAPAPTPRVIIAEDDDDDRDRFPRGTENGRAKLTEVQVAEARLLHAAGWTERALARRFKVSPSGMHYALARVSWAQVE